MGSCHHECILAISADLEHPFSLGGRGTPAQKVGQNISNRNPCKCTPDVAYEVCQNRRDRGSPGSGPLTIRLIEIHA